MPLNYELIINKISAPILVGKPIRNTNNEVTDFNICFTNSELKSAVGYIIDGATKWSEFASRISSDIPWFQMALDALEDKHFFDETFYSPSVKEWYKIRMNYSTEEDIVIVTFINVTSEKRYYKQLRASSVTDSLTGLQNRSGFIENFDILLDTTRYENKKLALLVIDIDDLKNINDSQGASEGDAVIIRASEILKQFKRDNISIYRYGDDEFAVIISGMDSTDSIDTITDTIFESFQMEKFNISGGISLFPEHSEQKQELIRFADMAIHHAKRNGKNTFIQFNSEMQRLFIQQLTLQTRMTTAVLESNFKLFYQPQFDINSGELRGFEALIRWNDSELGNIAPSVFIPLAEETGLIIPIGTWVLNTAFATLKHWQDAYNFQGVISVNVSPVQLKQENFIDNLFDLINKYQINPNLLEIEITEGVMINNIRTTVDKLKSVKSMGLRVSLDDFGTGYSSLNYLQALPLNTLKIDKSFINDITANDGIQANITSSIIKMVEKMGLETIAEGVENPNQLDLLKKFNCTIVQGFLRGKPMPFELCEAYLAGDKSALLTNVE